LNAITCQVTGAGGYTVHLSQYNVVIDVNATDDVISCFFTNEQIPVSIPTMTEWGIIIFILLAGVGSVYFLRSQKRAGS